MSEIAPKSNKKGHWRLYVAAALFVLVIIVTVQNTAAVPIELLLWSIHVPLTLLLLVTLLVGLVCGLVLAARRGKR